MSRDLSLAPCGLVIESVEAEAGALESILAHSASRSADCPLCGSPSAKIHSTYQRSLTLTCHHMDGRSGSNSRRAGSAVSWLPAGGEFSRSGSRRRPRRPFARRTTRLEEYRASSWAGPGRPSWRQSFARRLLLPVSKRCTLLRVVRRHLAPPATAARVVGIDDWAFRRGHRYGGTIILHEPGATAHHRPAARPRGGNPLPAWLAARPSIGVIATGSWCRLCSGCHRWPAECDPGGRPLAPDGERQCCLPHRRAAFDARSPVPLWVAMLSIRRR